MKKAAQSANDKFVERVKAMTPRKRAAFLKHIGKNGKLNSRYRD